MDKRLAEAVLATCRDAAPRPEVLTHFKELSWEQSYRWLDTSGMALYFLDRITRLGIEDAVPAKTLLRLQQNQRDNRARTAEMFREFVEINTQFRQAEIRYVNLKGITLAPDYFADPVLRFQLDLDFLVDAKDEKRCIEVLSQLGYRLTGVNGRTREFKAGGDMLPALRDMYKPKPQRSVEIHFTAGYQQDGGTDGRLLRAQQQTWHGFAFPALCESDKFLAQALHLFGHLRSEWTRAAWVLEYRNYIQARGKDDGFWNKVRERATENVKASVAIGMSSKFATKTFGDCEVPNLDSWTSAVLPKSFNLWIERYANDVLLANFPGSKLYLLLDEGSDTKQMVNATRLRKLLPMRRPPRVVYAAATTPVGARWSGWLEEAKYFLLRLRFHVATGLRYLVEVPRWRRDVINSQR